jgi:hypothetical protein
MDSKQLKYWEKPGKVDFFERYGTDRGGGRGIRTPVTLSGKAVFKTACFNRSHIPPRECYQ